MSASTETADKTRMRIVHLLKNRGQLSSAELGAAVNRTAMAIRLHLQSLQDDGYVRSEPIPAGRGRPTLSWSLTPAADVFFPDEHKRLAVDLVGYVKEQFGDAGMNQLVMRFSQDQIKAYARAVDKTADLPTRVETLARLRSDEGYMATAFPDGDDILLAENHCPICDVARACTRLCDNELAVFQETLGRDVQISREEHILSGARRCLYRIRSRNSRK